MISWDTTDHEATNRPCDNNDAGTNHTFFRWRLRAVNDGSTFPGLHRSCDRVINSICFLPRTAHALQRQQDTEFTSSPIQLQTKVFGQLWTMDVTSCCHGEVWRQNAEAKMKVLRLPSTHLDTQKGNFFQRRWNEHDKWKTEDSHGHTIARV